MADSAFVIMQIGADQSPERYRADQTTDFILKPELGEVGLTIYRADSDPAPGTITGQLLAELIKARVVIADLTGKNPNVYYELGIAHSFDRPVISLVDSIEDLPFDVRDQRAIPVGNFNPDVGLGVTQVTEARKLLKQSLTVVLRPGYVVQSPLRTIAAARSLDALAPDNPVAAELSQIREMMERLVRQDVRRTQDVTLRALRGVVQRHSQILDRSDLNSLRVRGPGAGTAYQLWLEDLTRRVMQPEAIDTPGEGDELPF